MKIVLALILLAGSAFAQSPINHPPEVLVHSSFLGSSRLKNGQPVLFHAVPECFDPEGKAMTVFWRQSDGLMNPNHNLLRLYRKPGEYVETLYVMDDHDLIRVVQVYVTISRKGQGTIIIPE